MHGSEPSNFEKEIYNSILQITHIQKVQYFEIGVFIGAFATVAFISIFSAIFNTIF